ncbi:MAG: hypothetical protein WKG07_17210 [Hymenobacter sp.]
MRGHGNLRAVPAARRPFRYDRFFPTPYPPVSFPEFAPVTTAQWQARLARELKGADPASLRWTLPEGLTLEPFYHREALTALGGPPPPLPPRPAPCRNVVALTVPAGAQRPPAN